MGQSTGTMTTLRAPGAAPHCAAGRVRPSTFNTHVELVTHHPHDVSVMHAKQDAYCAQTPLLNGSKNSNDNVCKVEQHFHLFDHQRVSEAKL